MLQRVNQNERNLLEKTPAQTLQPAQPPPNPDETQPPQPQQLPIPHLNK